MEEKRPGGNKLQLLSQALSAAIHSLNLAKQLVNEIERAGGSFEPPGLIGKYDGMFMVTEAGKKYPVPDNYAAKTKLVYGDKLKMIEGPEGRRFKYIARVPHVEVEAKLALKDGQFVAVAKEGSYRLIQSAVKFWNGAEGDEVKILLPRDEKHVPFAALGEIPGRQGAGAPRPEEEREKGPQPPERESVKKEEEKSKKEAPSRADEPQAQRKAEEKEKPAAAPKKKDEAKKSPAKKSAVIKPVAKKTTTTSAKKGEKKIGPPSGEDLV